MLDELGWGLQAPDWDGVIHCFLEYTKDLPELIALEPVRQWHSAPTLAVSGCLTNCRGLQARYRAVASRNCAFARQPPRYDVMLNRHFSSFFVHYFP